MFLSASSPSFDYEQWQRDHSRPAAKRLADLDVGEPRTVRMIYFLPNDRPYRAEVVDSMKAAVIRSQGFFSEEMRRHGYGDLTFRFETDDQSQPLVHRVDGEHADRHYVENGAILREVWKALGRSPIEVVVIDYSSDSLPFLAGGAGGLAHPVERNGQTFGTLELPSTFSWRTMAHELGHTFGLEHDFRDSEYIMSYGTGNRARLSACAAEFLAVHPYLNPDVGLSLESSPSTIDLVSPVRYHPGSDSIPVRLRISGSSGLHQVLLFATTKLPHFAAGGAEVKACRSFAGEASAVVEFDYDGVIPSKGFSSLANPIVHRMRFWAVDQSGRTTRLSLSLYQTSEHHVATLEEPGTVTSLSFSPDGSLASTAREAPIKLWNLATQEIIASLGPSSSPAYSVAISPDGETLASEHNGEVRLWDVATGTQTATLEVRPGNTRFRSVAFSPPDGKILAVVSGDRTVRLWDLVTGTRSADLEHGSWVASMDFSPDGSRIAVAGGDGRVNLWDPATGNHVTVLEAHSGWVGAVAFSPDGAALASQAGWDGLVRLWDVETWDRVAAIENVKGGRAMAFTPYGTTLACASGQLVKLWDVRTGVQIDSLAHGNTVEVVAFSPDGGTLATVTGQQIELWDATEWLRRPHPRTLVKISGDSQEGLAGSDLADPFVVEVKDQYGKPLPGAQVTFSIRNGGGKFGGRSTEEIVVTNADGLAQSIFTLGPNSGKNSVEAAVEGLEPLTFHSWGVGTSEPLTDYQTWHLPEGALARLGRGGLSQGKRAIAFSPGGRRLALLSSIGVWLYDVTTFRPLALLPTGHSDFGSLAFSPDGTTLVSSPTNNDELLKLWDLGTGEIAATLQANLSSPPVFSPDGTTVAFGSRDNTIRLWDVATGETTILEGHTDGVSTVDFSPDGSTLASGASDNKVRLWDLGTGETTLALQGHGGRVYSVAFSPEGTLLASASSDGTLRFWDVETGTHTATRVSVESVSFSADGILASGASDGTVKLWDVATGKTTALLEGHTGGISSVVFSPDGALASGSWSDGTVKLWNPATKEAATLEGHSDDVHTLAFSPDGRTLASAAGYELIVKLWDLESRVRSGSLDGHEWVVQSLAFFPDGTLASGSEDGTIRLWDLETGDSATLGEGLGWFHSVAISPDGATLASGSMNGMVKLWDVATGTDLTLEGHTNSVSTVAFSPSGRTLASGSWDRTVRLWDAATGTHSATLEGHSGWVNSVAFSLDGQTLASGGDDVAVRLWDVASRKASALEGHTNGVTSVAYSPDGTMLASGSRDRTVRIWEWDRGGDENPLVATFEPGSWVNSVAFSPDGTILASGGPDGTILLWDLQRLLLRPHSLGKVSGDKQEGPTGLALAEPLVVEVWDQNGEPLAGASVTFSVTAGGGTLSATTVITEEDGAASSTLTLGGPGTNTVSATVAGLAPVTFTATAEAITDFDGDGETGFSDFFLFADAFGGSDPRFDLDGSGSVDFVDFFLLADYFADPARGKLMALAADMIGLPDGPQLQQNHPNPFNSETVISWFQLTPGPARLEVFALTGQRVAILHQGPNKAGVHRVHFDGRGDQGRSLASGVYLYRLVTEERVQTRKLTLLR